MKSISSLLLLLASAIPSVTAALYDKSGQLVKSEHLFDPDVYWPYLLANDTRFNGVGLISFNQGTVNCIATLVKTWKDAEASEKVLQQKAIALTGGACYAQRGEFKQQTAPTPGLDVVHFNRTIDNAKRPDRWVNVSIESVEFATVTLTDLALVRLNRTIGDLLGLKLRFYPVARELPVAGAALSSIQFPDSILGAAQRRAPGVYLNAEPVYINATNEFQFSLRFKVNWGYVGAPVLSTNYTIVSTVSLIDVDFNAGPVLDKLVFCFDPSSGAFDLSRANCLKQYKQKVNELFGIRLPGLVGPNAKHPRAGL